MLKLFFLDIFYRFLIEYFSLISAYLHYVLNFQRPKYSFFIVTTHQLYVEIWFLTHFMNHDIILFFWYGILIKFKHETIQKGLLIN